MRTRTRKRGMPSPGPSEAKDDTPADAVKVRQCKSHCATVPLTIELLNDLIGATIERTIQSS